MTTITDSRTGDEILTEARVIRSASRRVYAQAPEIFAYRDDRPYTTGRCRWANCTEAGRFCSAMTHGDGALEWTGPDQWCGRHFDIGDGLRRLFDTMAGWLR